MKGWKTKTAGGATICTGIAMILTALSAEIFDPNALWNGILTVSGGLAVIGIGHKVDKI